MSDSVSSKPPRVDPGPREFQGIRPAAPRGARNRMTILAEALLEADSEEIMRKVLKLARNGDKHMLTVCKCNP